MEKPSTFEENELLLKLQKGDQDAFKEIYILYYSPLCQFAERLMGSSTDAEEIVGESLLKIWENRKTFNDAEHIKAHLYHSIRNACLNYIRSIKRADNRNTVFTEESYQAPHTPYALITQTEVNIQLYAAIASLPPQARKIITKTYIDGMTNQEVADELGLSIQTVKNQKQIGIAKLRNKLDEENFIFLLGLVWAHSAI